MSQMGKYDYTDAGFNGFVSRSNTANPFAQTLSDGSNASSGQMINFDQQQIGGPLGNKLPIGTIVIDGATGRISIFDSNKNEVGRLGNLGN